MYIISLNLCFFRDQILKIKFKLIYNIELLRKSRNTEKYNMIPYSNRGVSNGMMQAVLTPTYFMMLSHLDFFVVCICKTESCVRRDVQRSPTMTTSILSQTTRGRHAPLLYVTVPTHLYSFSRFSIHCRIILLSARHPLVEIGWGA